MSWLGRILGRREGPVYGRGDVPLEPAKAELLELLRERGARSAVIAYEGGNDEGSITAFTYSAVAVGQDASEWAGRELPEAREVDIDALEGAGGPDDTPFQAAEPWRHAVSLARKHGGVPDDYLAVHEWFDAAKAHHGDFRHRALRHHTLGVFECEREFGVTLTTSDGRAVPVRCIAEQHVTEDVGFVPPVSQWLSPIAAEPWMMPSRRLSRELERAEAS